MYKYRRDKGGADMELSVGGLIFLVILVVYALSERNKQDDKIADLKRDVIEKENKIKWLQNQPKTETTHIVEKVTEREKIVYVPVPVGQQHEHTAKSKIAPKVKALPVSEPFVQVIFSQYDVRRYDYLLGDNYDIRVGDFVKVWTKKGVCKIVQVVYVSRPGEVSKKAKSPISGRADYPKW